MINVEGWGKRVDYELKYFLKKSFFIVIYKQSLVLFIHWLKKVIKNQESMSSNVDWYFLIVFMAIRWKFISIFHVVKNFSISRFQSLIALRYDIVWDVPKIYIFLLIFNEWIFRFYVISRRAKASVKLCGIKNYKTAHILCNFLRLFHSLAR